MTAILCRRALLCFATDASDGDEVTPTHLRLMWGIFDTYKASRDEQLDRIIPVLCKYGKRAIPDVLTLINERFSIASLALPVENRPPGECTVELLNTMIADVCAIDAKFAARFNVTT